MHTSLSLVGRSPVEVRRLPHRRARGLSPVGFPVAVDGGGGVRDGVVPGVVGVVVRGGRGRPAEVPTDLLRQREDVPRADGHPAPLGN